MKVQNMSENTVEVQELSFSGSCEIFACVPTSWVEAACHAFQRMLPVYGCFLSQIPLSSIGILPRFCHDKGLK